jgi:hypothetical protein
VDNSVVLAIPDAMEAGLAVPLCQSGLAFPLTVASAAA